MLELNEIREQLRIDEAETSDALLTRYLGAAVRRFEARTGRRLFKDAESAPNPTPENAVFLDDDIALALLLLIGHWNVNREASTDLKLAITPQGFYELANPYRWWSE
nr:head-tail connector protein [Achromobacter ruhlandii]